MAFYAFKAMRAAALAAAVALVLSSCGKGGDAAQGGQPAGREAPAPVVGVVTVHPQTVALTVELPGRLESLRTADVRAQVGGIIQKRLFQEGSYVRAGQPLYQIDSSTYEAGLESARAQLATAQATLAKADADLARYKPLVAAEAVSRQEYDAAVTAKRSAEAGVKAAQAAIKSAGINLNRSRITAPISGFIGQSKVSEGTLLNAGDTTVLATIRQTNPMYVNVTQSASEVMKLRRQIAEGKLLAADGVIAVGIKFDDGTVYPEKGRLLFADPTVNESTGQITLRAAVPNDQNILMPGLYVRVLMDQVAVDNAFVVPQQAVTRGAKDTVMIVNAQGGMEPREVTVAQQQGTNWIVTSGLKDGDKVVVEGISIASITGAKKVTPKEWAPSENQAAAPQSGVQTASEAKTASEAE
ncbi:TPA: multidrug efflux RND transporter periplasmic adaptor subunit MtrC [Neisseria meningitidis]|uniref:multidrug efflux RND transporter periplasmic adaptor subunit MtrC n=1 Tax=Neisseria meningitidis TaxID=487 RepID=UPI0001FBF920|nr:multidrug efflux RND transporter periplasmic adaptor subunit MtrC [Neisseria meningitidis]AKM91954.1 Multidrug resistance protein mexA precursor [Neisseria meningitidis M0579]ANX20740.1 efflux transporter periplasmic adaptor subunit [Neisseria meningitidis]ANX23885.1 efflux transporter periplasmic adaptor subunit [Neisseria meningitidis]ANX38977.1 efflux transporter periplasmic adaptor subunit [Neisseria meningitidis]ANX49902.1 efflux transporter periplasmic adaptor subunit [Neisseria menin